MIESELNRGLSIFLEAAEQLSFSATARKLGITPAAVSKNIRRTEDRLGIRLFHRTTHSINLTDEGEKLYSRLTPLMNEVRQVLETTQTEGKQPGGKLRVSVAAGFGRLYLVPLLDEFCTRYPNIELDLRFEDSVVDLVGEGIDVSIGLRLNPLPGLVSRRICDSHQYVLATPAYLKANGIPRHPKELLNHQCIGYRSLLMGQKIPWAFTDEHGEDLIIEPECRITSSSLDGLCDLAAQGLGVTMSGLVAIPFLRSGQLVSILQEYHRVTPPMAIYYSSRENLSSRIRVFVDYVVENIRISS